MPARRPLRAARNPGSRRATPTWCTVSERRGLRLHLLDGEREDLRVVELDDVAHLQVLDELAALRGLDLARAHLSGRQRVGHDPAIAIDRLDLHADADPRADAGTRPLAFLRATGDDLALREMELLRGAHRSRERLPVGDAQLVA